MLNTATNLPEVMESTNYWGMLMTPSIIMLFIGMFLGGAVIIYLIALIITLSSDTLSSEIFPALFVSFLVNIFIFGLFISPNEITNVQKEAALNNIEANFSMDEIQVLEVETKDDIYQITLSFEKTDSPYIHETKMMYHETYEMMVPVIAEEYDKLPVKEGSDFDNLVTKDEKYHKNTMKQ